MNTTVADLDKGEAGVITEGKFEGRAFTVRSKGTMGRFVMVDWTEQGTRGSIDATTEVTR